MLEIALEPRASRVPMQDKDQEPSAAPSASRKAPAELVTAWVLSLLDCQPTYGYELHRQLEAQGVNTEISALYKTLRKLEDEECVASTWVKSAAGPSRRLYQLTVGGRRELDALVQVITTTRDVHAAFLNARRLHVRSVSRAIPRGS